MGTALPPPGPADPPPPQPHPSSWQPQSNWDDAARIAASRRSVAAIVQQQSGSIVQDTPLPLRTAAASHAASENVAVSPQPSAGTAPRRLELEASGISMANAAAAPLTVERGASGLVRVSFRDSAERAETMALALSATIKREIERLENLRLNEPEWQEQIDFLKLVSSTLDEISTAIGDARRITEPGDQGRKFDQAETLARKLAGACQNFAERNYERIVDYAGFSAFTILGTLLFTQWFGVSPVEALPVQLALLGFPGLKKDN